MSIRIAELTALGTIETPRLFGERIVERSFEDLCRLHRDPEVMKTLSADGKPLSDEATRDALRKAIDQWDRYGFDLWVFREKCDGRLVGRGGLRRYEIEGTTVIGLVYAVLSEFWNQGLATEMAAASVKIGFEQLGFSEIASWTLPTNRASQRVLEKLGFRYERDFMFAGLLHGLYRLAIATE